MKIALMCPSRQRLNNILTLISSIVATAADIKNINLVIGVDEDDPKFNTYKTIANNTSFAQLVIFPANLYRQKGLSGLWNYMYSLVDEDIIGMIGDDMIFETSNWDTEIINTFTSKKYNDNIFMVHCNDGMRGPGNKPYPNVEPLAVNSFVHRDYIEITGKYVEDIEPNTFHDTYIHTVFDILKRRIYYHNIMIRHFHFSQKGKKDEVADILEKSREGIWDSQSIWNNKIIPAILQEVDILKKYIKS